MLEIVHHFAVATVAELFRKPDDCRHAGKACHSDGFYTNIIEGVDIVEQVFEYALLGFG